MLAITLGFGLRVDTADGQLFKTAGQGFRQMRGRI
jgi:hypothetical protein